MDLREREQQERRPPRRAREFLRMPSISARKDDGAGFRECAEWVAGSSKRPAPELRSWKPKDTP